MTDSFKLFIRSKDYPTQDASNLLVTLDKPISLGEGQWEMGLVGGSMTNSVANISPVIGNNIIRYSPDNGTTWKLVTFPTGSYETTAIETEFRYVMDSNGDVVADVYPIDFSASLYLNRVQVTLKAGYQLDMGYSLIYQLLGFNNGILSAGASDTTFTAPNSAQFTNASLNYFVLTDLISEGVYISANLRYGVLKAVDSDLPNYPISFKDNSGVYDFYTVNVPSITVFRLQVLDALGRISDLRGEPVNYELKFRRVK